MIETGTKFVIERIVSNDDTAKALGSGELSVLATPKMIALMEESSYRCVAASLENGTTTVGTYLDIKHLAATPVGMQIKVESTLIGIDGRKLTFEVRAFDEGGLIGEGTHERFIVYSEKFTTKTYSKLNK